MNITENKKLRDAVIKGKLENILSFISDGGNVNVRMEDQNTLLHYVSTSEMTRALLLLGAEVNAVNIHGETPLHSCLSRKKGLPVVHLLIKYGVDVNMKNNFGQTPLHSAIADSAGLTVVRELLKHGANVNATDSKRNSVLFLAVKYYRNLDIIEELLEFDADINIRSSSLNRFFTPIDVVVHGGDVCCAKLLIKITILRNYHKDYRKVNDLESYIKFTNNTKLSHFLNDCISEITKMKSEKINSNHSLYDYVVVKSVNMKPLYSSSQVINQNIFANYSIYYDIILSRLKKCLQRADLLDKLKDLRIHIDLKTSSKDLFENIVVFNGDCLCKIGELLPNDDILNFLVAIDKNILESLFCLDKYL